MLPASNSRWLVIGGVLLVGGIVGALSLGYRILPGPPRDATDNGVSLASEVLLAEEDRKYLWDLEHHHNVLTKRGLRTLGRALQQQDRAALRRLMAEGFVANLPDAPHEVRVQSETLSVFRQRGDKLRELDREAFAAWLLDQRGQFSAAPAVRFDVMKLTPPSRETFDGTWQADCVMRMWNDPSGVEPREVTAWCTLDVDHPTKERLRQPDWLKTCTVTQVAHAKSSHRLFADVTAGSGIDAGEFHDNWTLSDNKKRINTGGAYACDYNRDGWVDLLLTDVRCGNRLYRGLPAGRFAEATAEVGLSPAARRGGDVAAFIDLDNDGWEDLFLPEAGIVCRNVQGTLFQDVTATSNLRDLLASRGRVSGVVVADYDRDGNIDLYVTRSVPPLGSWLESMQPDAPGNQLLRNKGDLTFEDVTAAAGVHGGGRSVFTASWFDANDDAWPDLYVINEFGGGILYLNQQGRSFAARQLCPGPTDFGSMGLCCGDMDNDGAIDLYVSSMYSKAGSRVMANLPAHCHTPDVTDQLRRMVRGSRLYRNQGDGTFKRLGGEFQVHAVGWAWGSAMEDFDNDGYLDLYATAGFMSRDRSKPDG